METKIEKRAMKKDRVRGGWRIVVKYTGPRGTSVYHCDTKPEARQIVKELHKQVNEQ